jgi:N utilization substance protein A
MNPSEVLRIVDAIHRDKNIEQEIVFQAIEAALVSAAKKNYGEESDIQISIHRQDGSIEGTCNGVSLDPEETVGRIGAQTAKQVIIQKIREAERDALYDEYKDLMGQMVSGSIQRGDGGATTVTLGNVEAILPRGEQIPGETHHANERIRATVFDVRKQGSRVKVILSRTRPQLVQRLFEQEIPEISEGVISVRAMAREPGYRSKVAVSSSDQRVDCVGACVGVRGNRIKNIVDELSGERIDIVRWSDDMQVLIPNALQPAEVDEVILCKMMGRAIVLVREDQLSLAIGRRGQNVRLASKLCGWDIEIMTREELEEQIDRAVTGFSDLEGVTDMVAEKLVGEGFLSYDDLSVIEPDDLLEMAEGELTREQIDAVIAEAEQRAEEAEQAAAAERRRQRELERIEKATAEAEALEKQSAAEAPEAETPEAETPAETETPETEASEAEAPPEADSANAPVNDLESAAEQATPASQQTASGAAADEAIGLARSEPTDTTTDDQQAAPAEAEEQAAMTEHPERKEEPRDVAD